MKHKLVFWLVLISFVANMVLPYGVQAQTVVPYGLPQPQQLLNISKPYSYPVLKGVKINPDNPAYLEFIIDAKDRGNIDRQELSRLVSYFLACLTIPEADLWVNLSPYEQNRITSEKLSQTDLGKDLLGEDYILKQLAASLTHPDSEMGKKYWQSIGRRDAIYRVRGNMDNFNKVWIVPDKALIYEHNGTAVIDNSRLKVMMDADFTAMQKNNAKSPGNAGAEAFKKNILPLIEKEVNTGENFARLRQIHNAFLLATWFKKKLKDSAYKHYIDQGKVKGIDLKDKNVKENIYNLYVEAFKNGVYNYVKHEVVGARFIASAGKIVKRQYFSGGVVESSENVAIKESAAEVAAGQTGLDAGVEVIPQGPATGTMKVPGVPGNKKLYIDWATEKIYKYLLRRMREKGASEIMFTIPSKIRVSNDAEVVVAEMINNMPRGKLLINGYPSLDSCSWRVVYRDRNVAHSGDARYSHDASELDTHYLNPDAHNYHTETINTHVEWMRDYPFAGEVVDLGSGSGILLRELLPYLGQAKALATDISEELLQAGRAATRDNRVSFENISVYDIGKQYPGRFNTAMMRFALHHFERAQEAVNNAAATLSSSGELVILDVLSYEDPEVDHFFEVTNRQRQPKDYKFYSRSQLKVLMAQAGLNVVDFKEQTFTVELEKWLAEYKDSQALLAQYLNAGDKIKRALNLREEGGKHFVDFSTFMMVARKAAPISDALAQASVTGAMKSASKAQKSKPLGSYAVLPPNLSPEAQRVYKVLLGYLRGKENRWEECFRCYAQHYFGASPSNEAIREINSNPLSQLHLEVSRDKHIPTLTIRTEIDWGTITGELFAPEGNAGLNAAVNLPVMPQGLSRFAERTYIRILELCHEENVPQAKVNFNSLSRDLGQGDSRMGSILAPKIMAAIEEINVNPESQLKIELPKEPYDIFSDSRSTPVTINANWQALNIPSVAPVQLSDKQAKGLMQRYFDEGYGHSVDGAKPSTIYGTGEPTLWQAIQKVAAGEPSAVYYEEHYIWEVSGMRRNIAGGLSFTVDSYARTSAKGESDSWWGYGRSARIDFDDPAMAQAPATAASSLKKASVPQEGVEDQDVKKEIRDEWFDRARKLPGEKKWFNSALTVFKYLEVDDFDEAPMPAGINAWHFYNPNLAEMLIVTRRGLPRDIKRAAVEVHEPREALWQLSLSARLAADTILRGFLNPDVTLDRIAHTLQSAQERMGRTELTAYDKWDIEQMANDKPRLAGLLREKDRSMQYAWIEHLISPDARRLIEAYDRNVYYPALEAKAREVGGIALTSQTADIRVEGNLNVKMPEQLAKGFELSTGAGFRILFIRDKVR